MHRLRRSFPVLSKTFTAAALLGLVATSCSRGPSADELTFRGDVYLELNKLDKAESYARQALAANASYADAHMLQGKIWARKNQIDSVIACYTRASEADPKSVEPLYALSNAYAAKNAADSALAVIRRAIVIKPDSSVGYNNEAVLLTNKGSLEEAIVAFKKAISKDDKNAQAHYNLGNVYVKVKRLDEAVVEFRRALEINPSFAQCYFEMATVEQLRGSKHEALNNQALGLMTQNNLPAAATALEQSVAAKPDYAVGHNNLAHVYLKLGQRDKSIEQFKSAARLGYADAQRLLKQENISWN